MSDEPCECGFQSPGGIKNALPGELGVEVQGDGEDHLADSSKFGEESVGIEEPGIASMWFVKQCRMMITGMRILFLCLCEAISTRSPGPRMSFAISRRESQM